jgi:hypothetical protein
MKKLLFILFIVAIAAMNSCRKDDADDSSNPGSTNSAEVNATISGRVVDETGRGLEEVNVISNGIVATSDANGIFLIQGNVEKKRCVLEFNKQGYMKRLHAIIPSSTAVNYVKIILQDEPLPQSFQTASGGTITLDHGGSVVFPSDAFVIEGTSTNYSGLVTIYSKHISPDNSDFSMLIPGGDLSAIDGDGKNVSLYSYGMASVTIQGSAGENLQLASGTTATITFPIATTQSGSAPQSIPLWYLDEEDALWKEEGQATRIGNNYVGNVSHFTWWNCDVNSSRATITGRVVDCEGTPLANVTVTVNNQFTLVTDQNGYYTNWVPAGMSLSFQVFPQGGIPLASQQEIVNPIQMNQNFTVPDLIVPCGSRIIGHLTDCNGQAISGYTLLELNNDLIYYQFSNDGNFNFMTIANTNYTILATSESGFISTDFLSSGIQQNLNLGELQLCNQSPASSSFIINGMGYTNTQVHLDVQDLNHANYYTGGNTTYGQVHGISNVGECSINLNFEGNTLTTHDASVVADSSFMMRVNGEYLAPTTNTTNHFIFTITEYGAVGDSIKGTFHGDLEKQYPSMEIVTITNGKFAFLRAQDY